jgi:hypothetical protein
MDVGDIDLSWNLDIAKAGGDGETEQGTAQLSPIHTHINFLFLPTVCAMDTATHDDRYQRGAWDIEGIRNLDQDTYVIQRVSLSIFDARHR